MAHGATPVMVEGGAAPAAPPLLGGFHPPAPAWKRF